MDLFKYIFNVKCIDKFYHFFFFALQCAVGLICFVAGEICLLPHSHLQLVALLWFL